jgi:lipoprotein-anchoring transpeptidase ErfK/SrfK
MNRAYLCAAARPLAVAGLLSASAFTAAAAPISLDPRAVPPADVTQVQYQQPYGAPVYQYPPQYRQYPQYQQQYAPQPQYREPQARYQQPQYEPPAQAAMAEPVRAQPTSTPGSMGGGFIEFLFSGGSQSAPQMQPPAPAPQPEAEPEAEPTPEPMEREPRQFQQRASLSAPAAQQPRPAAARPAINPKFLPQVVDYDGPEKPGTIIIDTRVKYLFLVENGGKAMRYGVGVGRPGFLWAGTKQITRKREWPDWTPPPEMIARQPYLPRHMEGGPQNPLGARAMYLGSSLYRIHGSNEPWTIGTNVSSGCIRMRNEDVIQLYERVKVGTKVVVI